MWDKPSMRGYEVEADVVFLFNFLCFLSFDSLCVEDTQQSSIVPKCGSQNDEGIRLDSAILDFLES